MISWKSTAFEYGDNPEEDAADDIDRSCGMGDIALPRIRDVSQKEDSDRSLQSSDCGNI